MNPEWSDFTVPAKGIDFRDHETGSSLANACAVGLVGALLYCDRTLAGVGPRMLLGSSLQFLAPASSSSWQWNDLGNMSLNPHCNR